MSTTQLGLIVGLTLGIVAAFGGFGAFVIAVVLGAIGLGVGRLLEGRVDLNALFRRDNSR
jgi:nitrate/nitrite transporter NarK